MVTSLPVIAADGADETSTHWYDKAVTRLTSTWENGNSELYLPFHAHHLRSAYTREQIDRFNENNFGLGYGRGLYEENGDWHGVYAIAFSDSHSEPQYLAGYGYKTFWPIYNELKFGLGYMAFITARSDIGHYTPFPLVLPMASIEYKKFSLDSAYIPGNRGNGNVLFFWGKVRF